MKPPFFALCDREVHNLDYTSLEHESGLGLRLAVWDSRLIVCCAGPGQAAAKRENGVERMGVWKINKPGLYPGPATDLVVLYNLLSLTFLS